jgi:uncharacterized protein YdhG (YjbR/CyaY superfamily)
VANTNYQSVDEYIAAQPEAVQAVLEKVRGALRKALPGAKEKISYQIPAFQGEGGIIVYFAGWKEHYSLYPAGKELAAVFGKELEGCKFSKGTIRFPLSKPVPVRLIGKIAKYRAQEVARRGKAKAKAAPKRSAKLQKRGQAS